MPHLRHIRDRLNDLEVAADVSSDAATILTLRDDPALRKEQMDGLARWLTPWTPEDGHSMRAPLLAVLEVALANDCRVIVVEHDYVCQDWQSEHEAFWVSRHGERAALVPRLHFFAGEFGAADLWALTGDEAYLGYSVIRPVPMGPVGRTVLTPPPWLAKATLCTVTERPSLFGTPFEITGVPFMQQDAELLSCAHAAIWQAHYVAANRNLATHRFTADIASLSVNGAKPRSSEGLTAEQIRTTFAELGLPTIFWDVEDLPDLPADLPAERQRSWADLLAAAEAAAAETAEAEDGFASNDDERSTKRGPDPMAYVRELAEAEEKHDPKDVAADAVPGPDQMREQMLRSLCRSVNSGIPAIVLTDNGGHFHAVNVVGWVRRGDLPADRVPATPAKFGDDDVILVVCDDQSAPYELAGDPLVDRRGRWYSLLLPALDRIELSGEAAELWAFAHIRTSVATAAKALEDEHPVDPGDQDLAGLKDQVSELRGPVSVRVQLVEGRALKAAMIAQGRGLEAASIYRMARLPKWVWVAEFHDRSLREAGKPCVKAEVVLDTTSHDAVPVTLLSSTLNTTKDASRLRAEQDRSQAGGPGTPWRSIREITRGRPGIPQVIVESNPVELAADSKTA